MQFSVEEIERRYGIMCHYSLINLLDECDLYSGTERDPEVMAKMDADRLIREKNGFLMPYIVQVSLFGRRGRERQKVCTQIIVFNSILGYQDYINDKAALAWPVNNY